MASEQGEGNGKASELDALRDEITRMRREYSRRLQTLEQRIEALSGAPQTTSGTPAAPIPPADPQPALRHDINRSARDTRIPNADRDDPDARRRDRQARRARRRNDGPRAGRQRDALNWWGVSLEMATSRLTPLAEPLAALTKVLERYRAEGKLPALLMSLAGGVALVLGSGFLLQYSFNNLLSEVARVALVTLIAVSVTVIGAWISSRRDAMAEYGASVIAIGLSIAYLAVWFSGPGYGLVGTLGETVGVLLVTATAYGLALRFETRITASLTVIGGAFAPWVMTGGAPEPAAYALLLTVLAFAGVHLALRIRWRGLVLATFAFTTVPLDWVIGNNPVLVAGLIAAHVLFYLFAWALLFDGMRVRDSATRTELSVAVANLALFAGMVYWLPANPLLTALLMAANIVPFTLILVSGLARGSNLAPLFMLSAGVLALVGLFAQLSGEWLAIGIAIEGALLIHLGFQLDYRSVRLKGVALLCGALAAAFWHTSLWALAGAGGWDASLAAMPGALVLLGAAAWLYASREVTGGEVLVRRTLMETASCVFALTVLVLDWAFLSEYALVLAPVPMYLLLWWAGRHGLKITECVALAHFVLLAVEVALGITAAGTTRFTAQPLLAQIARVELFISLWIWGWYYANHYRDGLLYPLSRGMRETFFLLLPIGLLPSLQRHFPEWFPLILWGSVTLCWEIQRRVTLRLIRYEHVLLVVIAGLYALTSGLMQYNGEAVQGYVAVAGGLAYFALLFYREGGLTPNFNAELEPIFAGSIGYFAACVFGVGYVLMGVPGGFALVTVALALLLQWRPLLRPLRGRLRLALWPLTFCGIAGAVGANLGHAPDLTLSAAIVLAASACVWATYANHAQPRTARLRLYRPALDLWAHAVVALSYLALLPALSLTQDGAAFTVLLIVHATTLLFVTLRPRFARLLWVSVSLYAIAALKILLWDMSDFTIVEKIVAFMIIGALLIGAAYAYQNLRNRIQAQ